MKWQAWCDQQNCAGYDHKMQCKNVTDAIFRPYQVKYGQTAWPGGGEKAWTKGNVCRDVSFLCTQIDGSVKASADLSVVGLTLAGVGQVALLVYSFRLNLKPALQVAFAFFVLAWFFLMISWAVFAASLGKNCECLVEADSNKGVVVASGQFREIINGSGGYTYGFIIGAWLLMFIPITLMALRIKEDMSSVPPQRQDSETSKVPLEVYTAPVPMEEAP